MLGRLQISNKLISLGRSLHSSNMTNSKLNVEGLAAKADLHGKHVLIRLDLNVPISKEGDITNEKRLTAVVPTLKFLKEQGAKCVIATHLGRPKDPPFAETMKSKIVAPRLSELIDVDVQYIDEIVGDNVSQSSSKLPLGGVLLLENVRFNKGETKNDDAFANALVKSSNARYYVNDAFGTAHRAHASTVGVCKHMDLCAAGFLMDKELRFLKGAVDQPTRPLAAIIGGAKVSTKVPVIESLLNKCDSVFLGGGMIFTFYRALGLEVGGSLVEDDLIPLAKQLMEDAKAKGVNLYLPTDIVAAQNLSGDGPSQIVNANAIPDGWLGLDIGPNTTADFAQKLSNCKTVVWNGPMGVFEVPKYAHGTLGVAQILSEITKDGAITIIGGGDSVAAVEQAGLGSHMSHISTGGGASLELLEGKELPGVAALTDNAGL